MARIQFIRCVTQSEYNYDSIVVKCIVLFKSANIFRSNNFILSDFCPHSKILLCCVFLLHRQNNNLENKAMCIYEHLRLLEICHTAKVCVIKSLIHQNISTQQNLVVPAFFRCTDRPKIGKIKRRHFLSLDFLHNEMCPPDFIVGLFTKQNLEMSSDVACNIF